jgi:hypothetical protein
MVKENTVKTRLKLTKINDIENLYQKMTNSNQLLLSPNIKFKHLGGLFSVIQFICSWQRHHIEVFIHLNPQTNIDKIIKNEILLIAFYLAKEVLFKDKDIRSKVLRNFVPLVQDMNRYSLDAYLEDKARKFNFLFLHGAKNEFLRLFYNEYEQFKSKKEIEALMEVFIKTPASAIKNQQYTKDLNCIKEIIYELLNNTDKHGRRNIKQEEIDKNIRGFFFDIYDFNDNNRAPFLDNQAEYKIFLNKVKQVLVISIFDSGEGIVKKYIETTSDKKEQTMSFEDKKNTLLKVFLPNTTSSKVPNSGMGLTYVEKNIKELQGLLSIKTNTLEYFLTPDESGKYEPVFTGHLPCVGTSITILIPLKFKTGNE